MTTRGQEVTQSPFRSCLREQPEGFSFIFRDMVQMD